MKLIKLLDNMTKGSRDKTKQKSEKRHETPERQEIYEGHERQETRETGGTGPKEKSNISAASTCEGQLLQKFQCLSLISRFPQTHIVIIEWRL